MVSVLALPLLLALSTPGSPEDVFLDAKKTYAELKADKARRTQRVPYEKVIQRLATASKAGGARADDCAYFAATVAEDLSAASGMAGDLDVAVKLNVAVADQFKTSSLADDALLRAARLLASRKGDLDGARVLLQRARKDHSNGDQARAIAELLSRLPEPPVAEKAPVKEKPVRKPENKPAARVAARDEKPRTHVDKAEKPAAMEEDTASREKLTEILNRFAEGPRDAGTISAQDALATTAPAPDAPAAADVNTAADPAPIKSVKIDAKGTRTELVLALDQTVAVTTGLAPATKNVPQRFYVDLKPALLGPLHRSLKGHTDARIAAARAAQFDERTVRVVFELKKDLPGAAAWDVEGRRVVITVGTPSEKTRVAAQVPPPPPPEPVESPRVEDPASVLAKAGPPDAGRWDAGPTLGGAQQLAREFEDRSTQSISAQTGLKIRRVVIDPGHGGEDPGAIGPSGLREKDLTLKIAKRVAEKLRKDLKMEVVLTREKDVFIPLEERTAIANQAHADLFISIHCNSNPNRRIYGVETYYLNLTDDNYAIRLAARENKTIERSISDLQFILADLAMKSNVDDSVRLSKLVQANVVGELRDNFGQVKDLGVKHALFYVLIGAKMPAILLESSFVSNKMEEQRLGTAKYQDKLAEGLVQGVRNFVEERQALAR